MSDIVHEHLNNQPDFTSETFRNKLSLFERPRAEATTSSDHRRHNQVLDWQAAGHSLLSTNKTFVCQTLCIGGRVHVNFYLFVWQLNTETISVRVPLTACGQQKRDICTHSSLLNPLAVPCIQRVGRTTPQNPIHTSFCWHGMHHTRKKSLLTTVHQTRTYVGCVRLSIMAVVEDYSAYLDKCDTFHRW